MELTLHSFGGVLVRTPHGNFAVNGGGSPEEMEQAYLSPEKPLIALLLTSEHKKCSRNAELFAGTHHVPVLTSFLTVCQMHLHKTAQFCCFAPTELNLYGVKIGLHHLRYDSIDPLYFTFEDDEKAGVVIDGKLDPASAAPLMDCSRILLQNEVNLHEGMPSALRRRILSVYNTPEELSALFRHYRGEIIRPGITSPDGMRRCRAENPDFPDTDR